MTLWLLLACAPADDCAAMCDAALVRYEGCMEEPWTAAYADAADFRDWCDTWSWEQRQLGEEARCATLRAEIEAGTCEEWPDTW